MANISLFGGGFFFSPFTRSIPNVLSGLVTDAVADTFGPWMQVFSPTPAARWMYFRLFNNSDVAFYKVSFGLGLPGSEVQWQPSLPAFGWDGFPFDFDALNMIQPTWFYSFPVTLEPGTQLSARISKLTPGAGTADLVLCMWG